MTDLGGSLAVASRGLFATGVSTDLSGETAVLCMQTRPFLTWNSDISKLGRQSWRYDTRGGDVR